MSSEKSKSAEKKEENCETTELKNEEQEIDEFDDSTTDSSEEKGDEEDSEDIEGGEKDELTKEELEEEIDDLESSLKKVMADFDNYKKRMTKEKKRIREIATEDLVVDLLEIVDDFERALENEDDIDRDGIEMIFNKLVKTLNDHGLSTIDAEKEKFDPMYHECVQSVECENAEKDEIIEVYQKGYMLNNKVIRPSKVKVAK